MLELRSGESSGVCAETEADKVEQTGWGTSIPHQKGHQERHLPSHPADAPGGRGVLEDHDLGIRWPIGCNHIHVLLTVQSLAQMRDPSRSMAFWRRRRNYSKVISSIRVAYFEYLYLSIHPSIHSSICLSSSISVAGFAILVVPDIRGFVGSEMTHNGARRKRPRGKLGSTA